MGVGVEVGLGGWAGGGRGQPQVRAPVFVRVVWESGWGTGKSRAALPHGACGCGRVLRLASCKHHDLQSHAWSREVDIEYVMRTVSARWWVGACMHARTHARTGLWAEAGEAVWDGICDLSHRVVQLASG